MYRGKRKGSPSSAKIPSTAEDATPARTVPDLNPTHTQKEDPSSPALHEETVRMKERCTAPFVIYDAQARRIVSNPLYDRTLIAELHRTQSVLLTALRTPLQAHLTYTPKELLYALEAALLYLCASVAVHGPTDPLRYTISDGEADTVVPQLESFLAHHNAAPKAVVALVHCLSEGASHDTLAAFLTMLDERLRHELDPAIDRKRSEKERAALTATKNNVQDITQLVRDAQTAYRSIDTASQIQRRQPQNDPTEVDAARSPAANAVPARMIEEAFYKVLRWVLAVEVDRRTLRAAAAAAPQHTACGAENAAAAAGESVASTASVASVSSAEGFAKVLEYDAVTGRLTLERATVSQRWGLLLNAKGLLVGLENAVRNATEAGERLYDAVQQQSGETGGLAILEVNRRRLSVRDTHGTESQRAPLESGEALEKLRASLTQPVRTLHLCIEKRKHADLTVPREVLFEVSYQGGEGSVGQRCLLMLERASINISWGLKLKYHHGGSAVLSDFAASTRLSDDAKNFLFDMRGRLRVLKLNNVAMASLSAAEMKTMISGALLLTLTLQVTDAHGEVPPELDAVETPSPAAEEQTPTVVKEEDQPLPVTTRASVEKSATQMNGEEDCSVALPEASTMTPGFLDDFAASIADEFLAKKAQEGALHPDADPPAVEAGETGMNGSFEDLDWAQPTTTTFEATEDGAAEDGLEGKGEGMSNALDGKATGIDEEEERAEAVEANLERIDEAAHAALLEEFEQPPEMEELEGTADAAAEDPQESLDAEDKGPTPEEELEAAAVGEELVKGESLAVEDGEATAVEQPKRSRGRPKGSLSKKKQKEVAKKEAEKAKREALMAKREAKKAEREAKRALSGDGGLPKAATTEEAPDGDGDHHDTGDIDDAEANSHTENAVNDLVGEEEEVHTALGTAQGVAREAASDPVASSSTAAEAVSDEAASTEAQLESHYARASLEEKEDQRQQSQASKKKTLRAQEDGEEETRDDATEKTAMDSAMSTPAVEPPEELLGNHLGSVRDTPLVDLVSTTAELAMKHGTKRTKARTLIPPQEDGTAETLEEERTRVGRQTRNPAHEERHEPLSAALKEEEDGLEGASRISLHQLLQADPLTFENDVRLEKFDGSTLELERTSTKQPWNIKVAFAGDDIIMTKLPPFAPTLLQHPYLRSLGASPQGEVKWIVDGLNGQDLSMMAKSSKTKALEAIKGTTKLSFVLKALRR